MSFAPFQLKNDSEKKALRDAIATFENESITVVGDLGVDRYTHGSVDRISPEAPVPIIAVEGHSEKLGLAANVAENVGSLGGSARVFGVVGCDDYGKTLKSLLQKSHISSSDLIEESSFRTILKERIVSGYQQLLRVDYDPKERISTDSQDALLKNASRSDGSVLILEDYAKGLFCGGFSKTMIAELSASGKKILVDPHSNRELEEYAGAYLLTPNKKEAEVLTGIKITSDKTLQQVGRALLTRSELEFAIVTLGKEGMAIFSKEGELHRIPTSAKEVFDVSGAGDTVIATIALGLSAGLSVLEAAYLGNEAAGIVVSKRGTATVTGQELLASV